MSLLRILFVAMLAAVACIGMSQSEPDYQLGPEDVIVVTVLNHPQFSGEYLIPQSGFVQMPVAGSVKVAGMSLSDLQAHLFKALDARIYNPEVNVTLKTPRTKRIYVLGDVRSPGVLDLKPGWKVAESLSAAGGLAAGIQTQDVMVTLEKTVKGEKISMKLDDALNGPDADKLVLEPSDVLRIESIATVPVYVTGKVKQPGLYRLRADALGIMEAVAQAGGVTPDASTDNIRIIRLSGKEDVVDLTPALVKGEATSLPRLTAGDVILVPESLSRFAILGYVSKPGYYNIPNGRSYTLSEAIAVAEGADRRGRLSRVGLVRVENGKEVRTIFDVGKYLTKGDATQNPEIKSGDVIFVPETDKIDLMPILGGLASFGRIFNVLRR